MENWTKYDESESRIRNLLLSWQTLYRLSYPVTGPIGLYTSLTKKLEHLQAFKFSSIYQTS